jgi:hypothetical protein
MGGEICSALAQIGGPYRRHFADGIKAGQQILPETFWAVRCAWIAATHADDGDWLVLFIFQQLQLSFHFLERQEGAFER